MRPITLLMILICAFCFTYWACKKNDTPKISIETKDPFLNDALIWIKSKITDDDFVKLDQQNFQLLSDGGKLVAAEIFLKGEKSKFVFISKNKDEYAGSWVEQTSTEINGREGVDGAIKNASLDGSQKTELYYKNNNPIKFIRTRNGQTTVTTVKYPNSEKSLQKPTTTTIRTGVQMRELDGENNLPPVTVVAYINGSYSPTTLYCLYYYNPAPAYLYSCVPTAPNGSNGGGSGSTPTNIYSIILRGGNSPIGNINDYKKCFTNMPGASYKYKVTICVSQPKPGTRTTWGFSGDGSSSSSNNGNPVNVGHTFLVFSETTPNGTITRNIGFYPTTDIRPGSPSAQGQLNNDSQHPVDVSIAITMTNSQFFSALNYVSMGNNPGFLYDLNSNNCSTFALSALSSAGFNLPRTVGSWPGGSGNNPGDLGEDLRTMGLSSNMTRSTTNNAHANVGTCY